MKTLSRSLAIATFAMAFLLFWSSAVFASCGDIITEYDYGDGNGLIDEREPIVDCTNPFNADSPAPFSYELTLAGQAVTDNSVISITEAEPVSGSFVINKGGNFSPQPLQLFRREGDDYRQVVSAWNEDFEINSLIEGEYVAVLIYDMPLFQVQAEPFWKRLIKNLFLPSIAYAYFSDGTEVVAIPFTIEYTTPQPTGASSVLFLPGVQASRLYMEGALGTENQLWEPNNNLDVEKLAMTSDSKSVNDIYTRDVLYKVFGLLDVYEGFANFLDGLVSEKVIDNWKPFAYDWRYDVVDVAEQGTITRQSAGESLQRIYPVEVIESLAASSKSGKVTIVAHSNGGLLAKALMIKLESEGKSNLVDNIVFVGSPQLGTPKAIATILHGYDQSLLGGLLVSDATARRSTINMPGAYGLLPSQAYVSATNKPLIQFDSSVSTQLFRTVYGNAVNTADELANFMIGAEGRLEAETIQDAILANQNLINETQNYHNNLLDTWEAPAGVSVTEIVGVGLDTEDGFDYREFTERVCSEPDIFGTRTCTKNTFYKPVPQMTPFGDGTVVGSSAEGYAGNKSTYYYNLFTDDRYKHINLTESKSVQVLVSNILSSSTEALPFLSSNRPIFNINETMIGVHSPVSLSVTDSSGNKVGIFNSELLEEIKGSSYREIAGSKYIIIPKGTDYSVAIKGEAEGGMTLTIDDLRGNEQTEISKIPIEIITASSSIVFSNINNEFTNILVDTNGNGQNDFEITTAGEIIDGGVVEEINYETLINEVKFLKLKKSYEKSLLVNIKVAKLMSEKSGKLIFIKLEKTFLNKLRKRINLYNRREIISDAELEKLDVIIKSLSEGKYEKNI